MDKYIGILKRAWATTWRYKILWLFGLFAGTGGSGGTNYNSGSGGGSGSSGNGSAGLDQLAGQAEHYLPLIIAIAVLLFLIGVVFFVLTFAAQGGLIHLVNEAEERRAVRAGDGWRIGFRLWGRIFLLDFIVGLPILVLVLIFVVIFGASLVSIIAGGANAERAAAAAVAGIGAGVTGLCCGVGLLVAASFAYSLIIGPVTQLGLRYAVLEDRGAWMSLKTGWQDFWAKRGAFSMYVALWLASMAYGIALAAVLMVFIIPTVILAVAGNLVGAAAVLVVAALVGMVPGAIFGAFHSAAWTIFFRGMTGREVAGVAAPAVPEAPYRAPSEPAPPAPAAYDGGAPPSSYDAMPSPDTTPPDDPWVAANELPPPGDAPAPVAAPPGQGTPLDGA
jgi:hypothetical protein